MSDTTPHYFKFGIGDLVRDKITNFEGIVIGRTHWITGCDNYMVKTRELKDGKPQDAVSIDENRLVLGQREAVNLNEGEPEETKRLKGGPQETISRDI